MTTTNTQTHMTHGDSATIARGHRIRVHKKQPNLGDFIMAYTYALWKATEECKEAIPTLIKLMCLVERENQVFFRSSALARAMETTPHRVARHLKIIRAAGLIERDPADQANSHHVVLWRICPFLVWRGTTEKKVEYINRLPHDHVWREYQEPEDGPDTDFNVE